jgi:hypothetical protein
MVDSARDIRTLAASEEGIKKMALLFTAKKLSLLSIGQMRRELNIKSARHPV